MNTKEMLEELKKILAQKTAKEEYPNPLHAAAYKRLTELGLTDKDTAIVEDDPFYDEACLEFAIKVLTKLSDEKDFSQILDEAKADRPDPDEMQFKIVDPEDDEALITDWKIYHK